MTRRRDPYTLDLLRDYQPPEIAPAFEPEVTKGGTLDVKIARAISEAMARSTEDRKQIAASMSDFLGFFKDGEPGISENMLSNYASVAHVDHKITLERFIALVDATDSHELLNFVCSFAGFVAVPARYAEVIRLWQTEERLAELETQRAALRGKVKGMLK